MITLRDHPEKMMIEVNAGAVLREKTEAADVSDRLIAMTNGQVVVQEPPMLVEYNHVRKHVHGSSSNIMREPSLASR